MKLILTSTGLENKYVSTYFKTSFLPKEPKDLSFLVISIQDTAKDAFYLEKTLKEIKSTGAQDIDVFKLADNKFESKKDYDVVFVCGGNTFEYLDRIKKTGLDKFIVEFSKKDDSTYVGVSAGSIVAGPNIETAGWGSEKDENETSLKDLSGLKLTDYVVLPHYRKEMEQELDKFRQRTGHPIIEIQDDQAIILDYAYIEGKRSLLCALYINKDI